MSRYWGAYDAEYDDGYRDVRGCIKCGNDCTGDLCHICAAEKFYDEDDMRECCPACYVYLERVDAFSCWKCHGCGAVYSDEQLKEAIKPFWWEEKR